MTEADTRKSDVPVLDTLGKRIAFAREAKRMAQPELAALVLESGRVATISGWERDGAVPDAKALAAIARALGVTADWLLFGGSPQVNGVSVAPVSDRERLDLLGLLLEFQAALTKGPGGPSLSSALVPGDPVGAQGAGVILGTDEDRSTPPPLPAPHQSRTPRKRRHTGP